MDVRDKVAVVTGGASGIGRGIGLALAEKVCHVGVVDLDAARAEATAAEIAAKGVRARGFGCDVSDEEAVETLAADAWAHFGHVDLLFNNAGASTGGLLLEATSDDLRWLFDVNVFGVWYGCRSFGRRFVEQGTPAWIVNTGSEHSLGFPHARAGFYTATKHAVLGLSDVLRHELPDFVGVSVLCPGLVRTGLSGSGRTRPKERGGPVEPDPFFETILEKGIDPLDVGRHTVAAVERGDFFIVTHAHARRFADVRHREIAEAFERQAPWNDEAERYDVQRVAREVLARMRNEGPDR